MSIEQTPSVPLLSLTFVGTSKRCLYLPMPLHVFLKLLTLWSWYTLGRNHASGTQFHILGHNIQCGSPMIVGIRSNPKFLSCKANSPESLGKWKNFILKIYTVGPASTVCLRLIQREWIWQEDPGISPNQTQNPAKQITIFQSCVSSMHIILLPL